MLRLKDLRIKRKISQQKLAIDLNLTQAAISKYELGLSEPDIAMLIKISDYFHVTVDYLVGNAELPKAFEDITKTEETVLEKYRKLDRYDRKKVEGYIDSLIDQ